MLRIHVKNKANKKLEQQEALEFLKSEIAKQTNRLKGLKIKDDYFESINDDVKRMEYKSYVLKSKLDNNFEQWEFKKPLELTILEAVIAAMSRFAEDFKQKPILNSPKA